MKNKKTVGTIITVYVALLAISLILAVWGHVANSRLKEEVQEKGQQLQEEGVRFTELQRKYHHKVFEYDKMVTDMGALSLELQSAEAYVELLTRSATDELRSSEATITAYSPLDDKNGINSEGDPTKTSTGVSVGYGKFAVDPARIPYGSRMLIVYPDGSVERGVAADTGGALRDAEHLAVDVFRQTFDDAVAFGKKKAVVIWQAPEEAEE